MEFVMVGGTAVNVKCVERVLPVSPDHPNDSLIVMISGTQLQLPISVTEVVRILSGEEVPFAFPNP